MNFSLPEIPVAGTSDIRIESRHLKLSKEKNRWENDCFVSEEFDF